MNNAVCPTDDELIPVLVGETLEGGINTHLQDCPACRRRLDLFRSDLNALRAVSIKMPPVAAPPARPSRIGKYLVVGSLDSGGQADVYRALHPTLDKEMAIKLSRQAVGRLSDHRPLLVAEGKLLAKLEHPGLARIYDLDFHDDLPFLAMEYVRGPNLRQLVAEGPVSPRRAASIVADVGRALAVVHRHGIVHQDVKPQNVLIDETDRPRLIDFGMARLRHAWDDSGDRTSGGTPAFMAPEQARGEEAAVGTRSDVFALGAVLYFLLTGQPPFRGKSVSETLALAGRCEFDRKALERPGVPRELRKICLKAMAAKPADRHARAEDLAADLDRYLTRPRRLARLGGGLAAVLVLAGLAIGFGSWHRTPGPVTQAAVNAPPVLELLVSRGGQSLDLAAALPLDVAGDRMQVIARVPPGSHAVMLKVKGNGKVQSLPFRESPADGYVRLIYPAVEGHLATLEPGVPGTEVILVFAVEKAQASVLENLDLENLTGSMLAGLPRMPPAAKPVWLTLDETNRQSRSFGGSEADAVAAVAAKLDHLRERLRDEKVTLFRGVAYGR